MAIQEALPTRMVLRYGKSTSKTSGPCELNSLKELFEKQVHSVFNCPIVMTFTEEASTEKETKFGKEEQPIRIPMSLGQFVMLHDMGYLLSAQKQSFPIVTLSNCFK